MGLFTKLFGTYSDRELKKIYPIADAIEKLEPQVEKLSDGELRAKTDEFKQRLAAGETLDDILPEAFAVVREAAWRVLGMKPFRVQLFDGVGDGNDLFQFSVGIGPEQLGKQTHVDDPS